MSKEKKMRKIRRRYQSVRIQKLTEDQKDSSKDSDKKVEKEKVSEDKDESE